MLPTMSAGMRSGVNWIRESFSSMARPRVRSKVVLPSPGTPSNKDMSPGDQSDEYRFDHAVLSNDDAPDFATNEVEFVSQMLELRFV